MYSIVHIRSVLWDPSRLLQICDSVPDLGMLFMYVRGKHFADTNYCDWIGFDDNIFSTLWSASISRSELFRLLLRLKSEVSDLRKVNVVNTYEFLDDITTNSDAETIIFFVRYFEGDRMLHSYRPDWIRNFVMETYLRCCSRATLSAAGVITVIDAVGRSRYQFLINCLSVFDAHNTDVVDYMMDYGIDTYWIFRIILTYCDSFLFYSHRGSYRKLLLHIIDRGFYPSKQHIFHFLAQLRDIRFMTEIIARIPSTHAILDKYIIALHHFQFFIQNGGSDIVSRFRGTDRLYRLTYDEDVFGHSTDIEQIYGVKMHKNWIAAQILQLQVSIPRVLTGLLDRYIQLQQNLLEKIDITIAR